jgi:hypothetical protein
MSCLPQRPKLPPRESKSKATDPQPESKLGIKKAGSAILINIDKTNQKMMVFLDGVEKTTGQSQPAKQDIQLLREPILLPL